jgi:ferric-dicitrate binding protein FerR (iron transport regulator)
MMHDPQFYNDFTAEQFAEDNWFQQWVLKMDQEQEEFWLTWLDKHPDRLAVILEARQLVEEQYNNNGVRPLSPSEKEVLKENIYQRLNLMDLGGQKRHPTRIRRLTVRMMAAASVLLLLASAWLLIKKRQSMSERHSMLLAERTGPNEMKKIFLPDSSVVILNANSVLRYNADLSLSESREVQLEGNAYFNVKKDGAYKSFVVHARNLSITVLGTELNVNARSAAAEVGLISGKVKVTNDQQPQQPVYLLPGDKISLDTLKNAFVRSVIDPQLYSAWTDGKWSFRHTALGEIAGLIKEYYGVEVRFTNEKSRHLSINAVIAVGSLAKLIPVLEQTLHIQMLLSESRLTIE